MEPCNLVTFPTKNFLTFRIKGANTIGQMFRYQYGTEPNKPWQIVDASGYLQVIEASESEREFLFVQQSYKQEAWSNSYVYQYDNETNSWNFASYPPIAGILVDAKPASDPAKMPVFQPPSEPILPTGKEKNSEVPVVVMQFYTVIENNYYQQTVREQEPIKPSLSQEKSPLEIKVPLVNTTLLAKTTSLEIKKPFVYKTFILNTTPLENKALLEDDTPLPEQQEKRPPLLDSLDLKGYSIFSIGDSSKSFSYLIGGGIQANISIGKFLGYTGLTFSKGPPKKEWVKSQQALALALGAGYPLPLSEKVALIPEMGYGVIFHLIEADFDNNGTYGFEVFIDQQVRLALYLTYALNEKYKLFIAPLGVLFFEKENFGIMYGCQAGLRFSL